MEKGITNLFYKNNSEEYEDQHPRGFGGYFCFAIKIFDEPIGVRAHSDRNGSFMENGVFFIYILQYSSFFFGFIDSWLSSALFGD